jgi:HAD-superfamily hydrolase, subfamily IIIA
MRRVAAFIDFQGTLGGDGIDDILSLEFYPFSIEAIKLLNDHGILAIGITNQSHISKGELTMDDYLLKLRQLKNELKMHGAHFDAVYCCPHTEQDHCACKKPLTGMVDWASNDFPIDIGRSYVIGDMGMTDMILANRIKAKGILVLTGVGQGSLHEFRHTWEGVEASFVAENVLEAAKWLLDDCNEK